MSYLKITFSNVDTAVQETLIAQLSNYDFDGFEQKKNELDAYIEQKNYSEEDIKELLKEHTHRQEELPHINWNKKWESDFEPIIIENAVAIRADFHDPIGTTKHEIIITPKMSFGTGHHATTQLMLEQLSLIDFTDKKVWDYGTGTGVLAVYAEKLGAKEIIANDIDPWSEENARENIVRNNSKAIDIRLGGIEVIPEQDFDVIVANINLTVLKTDMAQLFEKLNKSNGTFILSGVLAEKKEDITKIIKLYTSQYKVFIKEKWSCIVAKI